MNELIRITEQDGKQAVSARELHAFLGSKQQFADWIKNRIEKYGLIEDEDYVVFHKNVKNPQGGRPLDEYALGLDCAELRANFFTEYERFVAKQISMEAELSISETAINAIDFSQPVLIKQQPFLIESIDYQMAAKHSRAKFKAWAANAIRKCSKYYP